MNRFSDILRVHTIAASVIEAEFAALGPRPAEQAPDPFAEEREGLKRADRINDSSGFLMIFALFEAEVRRLVDGLIARGRTQGDWKQARSWTILDPEKLDFRRCLALLIPKGSQDYDYVISLYLDRNTVAHGRLLAEKPSVPLIAQNLEAILNRLQDAP